jgi:hypothetical protein
MPVIVASPPTRYYTLRHAHNGKELQGRSATPILRRSSEKLHCIPPLWNPRQSNPGRFDVAISYVAILVLLWVGVRPPTRLHFPRSSIFARCFRCESERLRSALPTCSHVAPSVAACRSAAVKRLPRGATQTQNPKRRSISTRKTRHMPSLNDTRRSGKADLGKYGNPETGRINATSTSRLNANAYKRFV